MSQSPISFDNAPINWPAFLVLSLLPLLAIIAIPVYAYFFDFSWQAFVSAFLLFAWGGLSITAGYHRLWAHRTYTAKLPIQLFLAIGGTMTLQNSILFWASGHRVHHRHVDDTQMDPYSAKRGLWFSHIGWMLHNYPSGEPDFSNAPDLVADPLVAFQHKYYNALALLLNVGIVVLIGYLVNDIWGCILLAGVLRIVLNHHTTFFINSLAHKFGSQPYTDKNTARDNAFLAWLTWGEGYHNFHHIFQYDYRNGVKWWQFDPTKWFIISMSWLGLTANLKRIPNFTIIKAEVAMKLQKAQEIANQKSAQYQHEIKVLQHKLSEESTALQSTISAWMQMKEQEMLLKKQAFQDKLAQLKVMEKELEQKMLQHKHNLQSLIMSLKNVKKAA